MIRKRDDDMGRFSVDVQISNNDDEALVRAGMLARDKIRTAMIQGVVDSGATRLVLPRSVVARLGLPPGGEVGVRYADGRQATRSVASSVHLTYAGRSSVFDAVVGPRRKDALIGAIVLEALDLVVDCTQQKLVPRDPQRPIAEIE